MKHTALISVLSFVSLVGCYGGEEPVDTAEGASNVPPPQDMSFCSMYPALPDLVVDRINVSTYNGQARVAVVIRNRGCAASGLMTPAILVNLVDASNQIATFAPNSSAGVPANGIPMGASQLFTWDLGYTVSQVQAWGGHWHVAVNPAHNVTELFYTNNTLDMAN